MASRLASILPPPPLPRPSPAVHLAPLEGRLIQTFMYRRSSPADNHYAHPLDLVPVVDLDLGRVGCCVAVAVAVAVGVSVVALHGRQVGAPRDRGSLPKGACCYKQFAQALLP
jgi:hypothetical protein